MSLFPKTYSYNLQHNPAPCNALERNYGVDLMRIFSMMMVVMLHVLGQGGVLASSTEYRLQHYIAWLLEMSCLCAVNCYALISGYVGVNRKTKYSNLAVYWLQLVFYLLGITMFFLIFYPNGVDIRQLFNAILLPLTTSTALNRYWYFTAYFALFLFTPFLNSAICFLERKVLSISIIVLTAVFSFVSIFSEDAFSVNSGYSTIWLIILYLCGGYIKKYDPFKNVKTIVLVFISILSTITAWIIVMRVAPFFNRIFNLISLDFSITRYTSPFLIITSISLLGVFSRIKFKKVPKLISFFAPLTFGVYLIHSHPLIYGKLNNLFAVFGTYNPVFMVLSVIGTALAIFIICSLIDFLRLQLFKLLKIKSTLEKIEEKIKNKLFKEESCSKTTEN